MKKLKVFKLHALSSFFLMSLCILLSNEVLAQVPCSTWRVVATEGQTLEVSGTQMVRYGVNGNFVEKMVPKGTKCSNVTFGDPAPGRHKLCSVCGDTSSASSCWTIIAPEHQRLKLSGKQIVRFVARGKYIEKELNNGAKCNSATFGSDPIPGIRKQCSICL